MLNNGKPFTLGISEFSGAARISPGIKIMENLQRRSVVFFQEQIDSLKSRNSNDKETFERNCFGNSVRF